MDTVEGNFILDTGCPNLVLNLTYFRQYNVSNVDDEERTGMTGTIASVQKTMVRQLRFGSSNYYRIDADLVNLGHIENSKGIKVLGLLGMSLLTRYCMIIDFQANLIHFRELNRKQAATYMHPLMADTSSYYSIPLEIINDKVIIRSQLAGKKLKMVIDSGSETNIMDSRLPDKIYENISVTGKIFLRGVGSRKVEALQGDMSALMIGNRRVNTLPVVIANLERTCFSHGGCADGILGFDFLSMQKIGFNFVSRQMYIWK